ncbi:helix-turn-helix domain-containing protein [Marinobacter mobilis]|uniref:helix-turn-helix domain-containing protein n=1 Tax=Marinobacter mobilis TaxID=488533 RepID=UPI0035C67003
MNAQPLPHVLYLWARRTLYIAQPGQPIEFEPAAAQLVVSLGAPFRYRAPDTRRSHACRSLLLAPGTRMTLTLANAGIATCYLDALGQDFGLLAAQMSLQMPGVYCAAPREAEFQAWFAELQQSPVTSAEAYHRLEQLINPGGARYPGVDPRVDAAVSLIRDSVAENLSVELLAEAVNLSVPRLVQLFRSQVGVPIRRYRQWHRLFVTAQGIARGLSLTDAAIGAGFTDSAHFSHTFRTILGLRPSDIFSAPGQLRLIVADS